MDDYALLLSRIQFAMAIGFHFIFPPVSIGLAWFLTQVEWYGWRSNDDHYVRMGKFFGRIFALTFALGVATGIVMEFQFGMNWARYSEFVGDIFGAPLAAEGVFAFFLESGFLGLYLFGRGKVSKGIHWFSSLMIAVGATMSAFWILVANSWQQTPDGCDVRIKLASGEEVLRGVMPGETFELPEGATLVRAELTNFSEAIFNPSTAVRFCHQINACVIVGAFVVAGISAYLILREREVEVAKRSMKLAIVCGVISTLVALFVTGDIHAKNIARFQPAKLAAFEGLMETKKQAGIVVFGLPTEEGVKHKVEIPGVLSWLAYGDVNAEVKGLNDFPKEHRPPIVLPFAAFHAMVGLGSYFIALMLLCAVLLWRGRLYTNHLVLKVLIWSIPLPILANQLGWITAEVGRQPWIVYGILKTSEAHSKTVKAGEIVFSLIFFGMIYVLLVTLYIYLMIKKVKAGPEPCTLEEAEKEAA